VLGTEEAGAGASRPLYFEIAGTYQWFINQFGIFPAQAGLNIGSAANRVQNIYQNGPECNNATVVSAPTSGTTVTVAQQTNCEIIAPAGSLAALTIQFPTPLGDGHIFQMPITQAITALTLTPNSGATIVGGLSSTAGYTLTRWLYTATGTTWYRIG
jgi:hypothetical protein